VWTNRHHDVAASGRGLRAFSKISENFLLPKIPHLPRPNLGADPNLKNAMWAIRTPTNPESFAKKYQPIFEK